MELDLSKSIRQDLLPYIDRLAVNDKTRNDVVRDILYGEFGYTPKPRSDLQRQIDRTTEQREEKRIHNKSIVIICEKKFIAIFFRYAANQPLGTRKWPAISNRFFTPILS